MSALQLVATRPGAAYDDVHEVVRDHPALPSKRARTVLRRRCLDKRATAADPICWWHTDGPPWSAVTDLHRAGGHDDAVALAVLLRWCETTHTHEQVRIWWLVDVPAEDAEVGR